MLEGDKALTHKMMTALVDNFDEEHLLAMAPNVKVAGSATKKKHDNENASSRFGMATPPGVNDS